MKEDFYYVLKKGSQDINVRYLQYCLRIMCINTSNIDGIFGNDTYNAVLSFQRENGFFADGMIRANTKANLFNLTSNNRGTKQIR
uniref:peptidoglycan-binding domain-containing protein n=1 Tax=Clostridium haemolyticum TaxID=84025 RepID=UPI002B4C0DBC|nr:peptidoglycan-binding domain-containing protein [Clostridium haemolyticum]